MNHVCTYVSEENERGNYAIKINSGKKYIEVLEGGMWELGGVKDKSEMDYI